MAQTRVDQNDQDVGQRVEQHKHRRKSQAAGLDHGYIAFGHAIDHVLAQAGIDKHRVDNHHTDHQASDDANGTLQRRGSEPEDLSAWSLFHEQVERLPDELRETFNLLYYEDLSQEESANVLGVSVSTVKRRWQEARVRLHDELGETT